MSETLQPPKFPQDEGAHPGIKSEWWYVFGFLSVDGEERYSFFGSHSDAPNGLNARFNIPLPNIGGTGFLETGFTDLRAKKHQPIYLLNSYPPVLIGPPVLHPGLTVGMLNETFTHGQNRWSIVRISPTTITLQGSVGWGEIDLVLTQPANSPPFLIGGDGIVRMGPNGLSNYYSITKLQVQGVVKINGTAERVTGQVWHDHQWGNMALFDGYEGWTWMGLNLSDGTDLNLFRFNAREERPVTVNYDIMYADGSQKHLEPDLDAMSPLGSGWWQSPTTGAWFALKWTIEIPEEGISLRVEPYMQDQEMPGSWPYDTPLSLVPAFYEGAVKVTGTRKGQPVTGRGYLEIFGAKP